MSDWITFSPSSGNGNMQITITAETLSSLNDRVGQIIATNSTYGLSASVSITQKGGSPTGITFNNVTWVTDIPASGGTATSANCSFTIYANYGDGTQLDITNIATVSGSLNVGSATTVVRSDVGDLELTASFDGLSASTTVDVYQEGLVVTSIAFSALTWVTDVPASGGTADSSNCSYTILAYYDIGASADITSSATVSGSLNVPALYRPDRNEAGTLELTATYSGFSATSSVTAYRAAYLPEDILSIELIVSWTTDVDCTGGTATKDNCTYSVYANIVDGTAVNITNDSTITGSTYVPFSNNTQRHSADTLTLTASYWGFTDSETLTVYQEGYDYYKDFLTIENTGNTTVTANTNTDYTYSNYIKYSLDSGATWYDYSTGQNIEIPSGSCVKVKGAGSGDNGGHASFNRCSNCIVYGNALSIQSPTDFRNKKDINGQTRFLELFKGAAITDAEHLVLQATGLTAGCYQNMFQGCKYLTKLPELPATTLANSCYAGMFSSCTGITTLNTFDLPATTLANSCYAGMFSGCMGLIDASLFSIGSSGTVLANNCCEQMFAECKSLTGAPQLPSLNLAKECYKRMFQGCNSLTTLPELPATTLAESCYGYMFSNCNGLIDIEDFVLPATALTKNCYIHMFGDCSGLTTALSILPATVLAEGCYNYMFEYCLYLVNPPVLPATSLAKNCYSYMFAHCVRLEESPVLPATNLTTGTSQGCYSYMFHDCQTLKKITCHLNVDNNEDFTYRWTWLVPTDTYDGGRHRIFVKNPNMDNWTTGLDGIPENWIVQNDGVALSSPSIEIDAAGGSETITVTSYSNNWTASTSSSWINVIPSTGGTGSTSVIINVTPTSTERNDNITFSDGRFSNTLNVEQAVVDPSQHLTFKVISGGTITWKSKAGYMAKTISYSKDNGSNWTQIAATTAGVNISVNAGDVLIFKGDNSRYASTTSYYNTFGTADGAKFNAEGNIMSLITSTGFESATTLTDTYTFYNLFNGCNGLISAKNMLLPAETLSSNCYQNMFANCTGLTQAPRIIGTSATTMSSNACSTMFQGCSSLTTAPELPATTLSNNCYQNMFQYCTSLTSAPSVLPATTLANYCYASMFYGCSGLTSAPAISATTLAESCCNSMFEYCSSLTSAPELPATTLANYCYDYMFEGCTALTTAPSILPATTLKDWCYNEMFRGCTSLTTAPELPATTLIKSCYNNMFSGCTSLNNITCLATDISASNCTYNWVSGVSSSGTFYKNPSMSGWTRGTSGVPNNWTIVNAT